MITEDFAYERLWEQKQYIDSLRLRKFSYPQRKWDIGRSAIFIYWFWKAEVKKIQDKKRTMEQTITVVITTKKPLDSSQIECLKTKVKAIIQDEFDREEFDVNVTERQTGKKMTGNSTMQLNGGDGL
jgi:hypothetical protein